MQRRRRGGSGAHPPRAKPGRPPARNKEAAERVGLGRQPPRRRVRTRKDLMPKRSDWSSDLLTIGLFAPLVMASRLQRLALEGARPSAKGRREAFRMSAEKPLAAMEGIVAGQKQRSAGSSGRWRGI